VLAAIALALLPACAGPAPESNGGKQLQVPLSMEGVTFSEFDGSRLRQRVHTRQLLVVPKAYGPFQVAGLLELVLNDAQFDVFLDDACRSGTECAASLLEDPSLGVIRISRLSGGPPLGGARIFDVRWVLWRGESPVARFTARQASVARGRGVLELRDARLEHVSTGRVIHARQAVWDPTSRSFEVRGGYYMQNGEARSTGESTRMDFGNP